MSIPDWDGFDYNTQEDIKLVLKIAMWIVLAGAIATSPCASVSLVRTLAERQVCQELIQAGTAVEYRFTFWAAGCQVNVNGYWLDYDEVDLQMIQAELETK